VIAIDSNILLRYLLGDHKQQTEKADIIINGGEKVLITDVVLAEVIWTLAGRKYRLGREEIVNTVEALFKEPNLRFEDDHVVWQALHAYRTAEPVRAGQRMKETDFADALIVNKAYKTATALNTHLQAFYTFDVAAGQLPFVRLL